MKLAVTLLCLLAWLAAPAHAAAPLPPGVAWHTGDVDSAFARARQEGKPLFLYWGAVWCPPCNQVKATVFSRQDFIARAQLFVPVYVDGDAPGAQALGSRFKVGAYPTMILFRPDGTEITRLPGEVDGESYMQALALGASRARPAKELLAAARAGKPLAADAWRLLAFYSWETDGEALLPRRDLVPVLWQLAQASTSAAPEASARLALKAISAASRDAKATLDKAAALQRQAGDGTLARLDRLAATDARVALARLESPKGPLPLPLLTEVRAVTHRAVKEATDPYEREAVISASAQLLADAGLLDESDALLNAELKRWATPYYLMLGLAANARQRGDAAAALSWYEQAYAGAQGPATRLQWGASYVRALVDLAPADAARIERAAASVIRELEPKPETFHGRNEAVLGRLGARLNEWNQDGSRNAVLARLREQMAAVCAQLPAKAPERATCADALSAPKS